MTLVNRRNFLLGSAATSLAVGLPMVFKGMVNVNHVTATEVALRRAEMMNRINPPLIATEEAFLGPISLHAGGVTIVGRT